MSRSVPKQEGAQEGHFRQRTEPELSSRLGKVLVNSANNKQFVI